MFLLIGCVNTAVGAGSMFLVYNFCGWSYWAASALNYVLGNVVSFVLNRRFTFRDGTDIKSSAPRFLVNILVCYAFGYGIAGQAVRWMLAGAGEKLAGNVAMLVGMAAYTGLNYFGQRYFVFRGNTDRPC